MRGRRKFVGKTPRFRNLVSPIGRNPDGLRRSPYYWWWQYLRRSTAYLKCCEGQGLKGSKATKALYQDFGDVRSDDFRTWWRQRGEDLFCEPNLPTSIQRVDSAGALASLELRGCMLVVVPLTPDKRTLKKRFGELLRLHHGGRRGGDRFSLSLARYPLATKPVASSLEKTLRVYDLWLEHGKRAGRGDGWPLWRIGEAAEVSVMERSRSSDSPAERRAKRQRMTILVSRYLKHANAYIRNAARGEFPRK